MQLGWPDQARVVLGVSRLVPRKGFDTAIRAVGVSPDTAVHVGDSLLADVRGAEASGIAAVHVDPLDRCPHRDHPHVATVREVPSLLGFGPTVPLPAGRLG